MEGGSWTNNISWVRGYEHLLGPMESASVLFAEKVLATADFNLRPTVSQCSLSPADDPDELLSLLG